MEQTSNGSFPPKEHQIRLVIRSAFEVIHRVSKARARPQLEPAENVSEPARPDRTARLSFRVRSGSNQLWTWPQGTRKHYESGVLGREMRRARQSQIAQLAGSERL